MIAIEKCIIYMGVAYKSGDIVHIEENAGFTDINRDGRIVKIEDDIVTMDISESYRSNVVNVPVKDIKVIYLI